MGIPSMFDRVAFVSDRFFHGAKVLIVLRKMAESFLQRRVHMRQPIQPGAARPQGDGGGEQQGDGGGDQAKGGLSQGDRWQLEENHQTQAF